MLVVVVWLAYLYDLCADRTQFPMNFAIAVFNDSSQVARILVLDGINGIRIALFFTTWSAKVRQL